MNNLLNFKSFFKFLSRNKAYRLAQHVKDRYPEVEKICPTAFSPRTPINIGESIQFHFVSL